MNNIRALASPVDFVLVQGAKSSRSGVYMESISTGEFFVTQQ